MSDRHPHWDAELLDAVAMHVYAVIAAVEDWARWEHVPKGTLRRLEQAEAAIARVREVCKAKQGPRAHDDPYNRGWDAALTWVERALDGPQ